MMVNGQVHSRPIYLRKITPVSHWIKGTVDPRADTDALEKLKISWPVENRTTTPWIYNTICVIY
jgi:hypothetical protein